MLARPPIRQAQACSTVLVPHPLLSNLDPTDTCLLLRPPVRRTPIWDGHPIFGWVMPIFGWVGR
eukprot:1151541-Prymnesium_polylepis.2